MRLKLPDVSPWATSGSTSTSPSLPGWTPSRFSSSEIYIFFIFVFKCLSALNFVFGNDLGSRSHEAVADLPEIKTDLPEIETALPEILSYELDYKYQPHEGLIFELGPSTCVETALPHKWRHRPAGNRDCIRVWISISSRLASISSRQEGGLDFQQVGGLDFQQLGK